MTHSQQRKCQLRLGIGVIILALLLGVVAFRTTYGQEEPTADSAVNLGTTPNVEVVSFSVNGQAEGRVRVVVTLTEADQATDPIFVRIHRHTIESLQNGGLGQVVYEGSDYPIIDFVAIDLEYGQTSIWQMALLEFGRETRYYGMPAAVSGIPHTTRLVGDEVYVGYGGFQSVHFTWEWWGLRPDAFQICASKQLDNGHWGPFDKCSELLQPSYTINSYTTTGLGPGLWHFRLTSIDDNVATWLWVGPIQGIRLNDWGVNLPLVQIGKGLVPTPIPDTPD